MHLFKSDGNNDEANEVHLRQKRSVIYLPEGSGDDFNENVSLFDCIPQQAEAVFNEILGPRNKNYPGLISMLQGFQKCIA